MKIYTRTGDKGMTGLFGGQRVQKDDARLHAYGTIDELNALLGVVLSGNCPLVIKKEILCIQQWLFELGSDLATPQDTTATIRRLPSEYTDTLERWIDAHEKYLTPLQQFILPGGTQTAALLQSNRTLCRRAERWTVTLARQEKISPTIIPFLNRLSDYFFVAARRANALKGVHEVPVIIPRAPSVKKKNSKQVL